MSWATSLVLVVVWLMGLITGQTLRGFVHLLPLLAITVVLVATVRSRRRAARAITEATQDGPNAGGTKGGAMRYIHRGTWAALTIAIAMVATAGTAAAYQMAGAGVGVGYTDPEDANGAMAIRGHLEFQRPDTRWHLQPDVTYFKSDELRDLSANADACYHFDSASHSITPYLGAGLGVNGFETPRRSETALGANLVGGFKMPTRSDNHLFLESRLTVSDFTQVSVMGGITFGTR